GGEGGRRGWSTGRGRGGHAGKSKLPGAAEKTEKLSGALIPSASVIVRAKASCPCPATGIGLGRRNARTIGERPHLGVALAAHRPLDDDVSPRVLLHGLDASSRTAALDLRRRYLLKHVILCQSSEPRRRMAP